MTAAYRNLGGYVLAGGRSTRMSIDKSLLVLAGRPLVEHAVTKLRRICDGVHILSNNPMHAAFAPIVPDLHPESGPLGGIEAALAHSSHDWSLILPVDMPFLPAALLENLAGSALIHDSPRRIEIFTVDGRAQPALCLLHKEVSPYISAAVARRELKLLPVLESTAAALAAKLCQPLHLVFHKRLISRDLQSSAGAVEFGELLLSDAQLDIAPLWFANLNTPEDFAEAEAHIDALDT